MAKRSSGCVNVNIVWVDRTERYRAIVSSPEGREVVHVGAPAHLTRAVDNPKAYDDAARAAISFAEKGHADHADYTSSGVKIARKAAPSRCRKR